MKMVIGDKEHEGSIDTGQGDIGVEEHYIGPSAEWPMGSYMQVMDGIVTVATGYYAKLHPGKPSPYWHEGPPFVIWEPPSEWPWKEAKK